MRKLSLIILLALVALVITSYTSASAEAEFTVSNLTISPPDMVEEGEIVTISANVTNTGDATGNYTVDLLINGDFFDTQEVIGLEPLGSELVSFALTTDKPGDYLVKIDSLEGIFTVKSSFWSMFPPYIWAVFGAIAGILVMLIIMLIVMPPRKKQTESALKAKEPSQMAQPAVSPSIPSAAPQIPQNPPSPQWAPPQGPPPFQSPSFGPPPAPYIPSLVKAATVPVSPFSVSNLTITPGQVKEGDPVTISATVTNNSPEMDKYSLVLRIGSVVENIVELTLSSGASQTATFTVTKEVAGNFHVEVDGLSGAFTVLPRVPATFALSNLNVTPERVRQGETIIISAVVTNTGETAGNYSIVLRINGIVDGIQEVTLAPGRSQRVAFNITKDSPSFYQVNLDGLIGRFAVEMDWNE